MQTFDGRYFEYKGEKYKKSLIKDDLKMENAPVNLT